jgi:23S rRNA (cytidine2498-2'-O)-methyltransferase
LNSATTPPSPDSWLLRISEVFEDAAPDIIRRLNSPSCTKLGDEYFLVRPADPADMRQPEIARFVRWNMPVHHSWPCCPRTMDSFVEKAAQALSRKFATHNPQTLLIGLLHPGSRDSYYKKLASNLRGRTLQLFPPPAQPRPEVEAQDPDAPTLFCLLGKEGLFCGLQSPRMSNGFYAGGTKFISQNSAETISRAGAKIAEALHYLCLHRALPPKHAHWLELGASPGGMTSELLARGYRVTAVDRAPLDARLDYAPDLTFICGDAATCSPPAGTCYDAILSDMNGEARSSIEAVLRLTKHLKPGGLVIFTLKTAGVGTPDDIHRLCATVAAHAAAGGLRLLAQTHLTYNRREFTMFFEGPNTQQQLTYVTGLNTRGVTPS